MHYKANAYVLCSMYIKYNSVINNNCIVEILVVCFCGVTERFGINRYEVNAIYYLLWCIML